MKLFVYPNARTHSQDRIEYYKNTTPLSEEGIKRHCTITSPEEADFFYMGQISCGTYKEFKPEDFSYLKGNEHKHILDLEGDWLNDRAPQWLLDCICTGNAARTYYKAFNFLVRPCFSKLLVHLAKNNVQYRNIFPEKISFGFKGQMDPYQTRYKLYHILRNNSIQNEFYFNNNWSAQIDLKQHEDIVQSFAAVMKNNILALCPRGCGEDTIRFYEACFFSRVPVIVGNPMIMDEDLYENQFYYKINPDLTDDEMTTKLLDIYNTPMKELKQKAELAKKYFDNVVVEYFKDPTKYFLNFLNRKKLYGISL
jgi:hypothetical protein